MNIILKYFPNLTELQKQQFSRIEELYPEWNDKINVISRKDIQNLEINHILHSLSISEMINFKDGTKVLDMGTGGGFPAIPLAILFPNTTFHLIDRIAKKLRVAENIAEEIGLKNVSIQHGDIKEVKGKFDFVVSRAVMRLDELVPLVKNLISSESKNGYPNGLICLKGGDITLESEAVKMPIMTFNLSDYFKEDFFATKKLVYVQF